MEVDSKLFDQSDLDKAMRLQNGLISAATGSSFDDADYMELRRHFASRPETKAKLSDFVRRCSDVRQFWSFIKYEYGRYQDRRNFIWESFRPLIGYLEAQDRTPGVQPITEALQAFDPEHVHTAWQKALGRRNDDPEGAITAARTLIETVCKHVLDDSGASYPDNANLPKLWSLAAEQLTLAPNQHQEPIFKAILGNCQSS